MPAHHLPRLALTLLLAGSTALAACSRDEPGPPPGSSTTSAATTPPATTPATTAPPATEPPTTPPVSDEAAIEALLDRYWDVILGANNPPNPDFPELHQILSGPALERAVANIRSEQQLSQIVQLPQDTRFSHQLISLDLSGDRATARECVVDDALLIDAPSSSVLNSNVITILFRKTLVRTPDGWRIDEIETLKTTPGESKCDG